MAGIYTRKIGATADHLTIQLTGADDTVQDLTGVTSVVIRVEGKDDITAAVEGVATLGQVRIPAADIDALGAGSYKFETIVTFADGTIQHYPRGDTATYLDPFDVLVVQPALTPAAA